MVDQAGAAYWGQWLDETRQHDQKGVYGTTAAVQILLAHGDAPDLEPIASALRNLPIAGTGLGYKSEDSALVFKVAAIVETCAKIGPVLTPDHPAVAHLLSMRTDGRGWGTYASDATGDTTTRFIPTAIALSALAAVPAWTVDPRCQASLVWLSERLAAGSTDDLEDALGLLALNAYSGSAIAFSQWHNATQAATARVVRALRQQANIASVRTYHYPVALDGPKDKYFYYLPSVIGALALLSGDPAKPAPGGTEIAGLVKQIANSIERDRALRTDGRIATVNQLWVDRMLEAFAQASQTPARLLRTVPRLLFGRRGRWFSVPALVVLVVLGVSAAADKPLTPTQVVGTLVAGLGLNVLANLLFAAPSAED